MQLNLKWVPADVKWIVTTGLKAVSNDSAVISYRYGTEKLRIEGIETGQIQKKLKKIDHFCRVFFLYLIRRVWWTRSIPP